MSTFRRLLFFTALLIGLVLLGAQAVGMLAAHRYLTSQLAQQSDDGAIALAWALSNATGGPAARTALADELYAQGGYALVRIMDDSGNPAIERRTRQSDLQSREHDWRDTWLNMEAPAVSRPYAAPDGSLRGTVTVQAD